MNSDFQALVVANTPFELYLMSASVVLLKNGNDTATYDLLIKPKLKPSLTKEIREIYRKVIVLEFPYNPIFRIQNTHDACRACMRVFAIFLESWRFRRELKALEPYDLLLISSYREYFSNIMLDVLPEKTRKVVIRMAGNVVELNTKRRPIASCIANMFNRLFGRSYMEFRWNERYLGSYTSDFAENPYDMVLHVKDGIKTLTPAPEPCHFFIPGPFRALQKLYARNNKGNRKKILVIGERTPINPDWNSKGPKDWEGLPQQRYNEFLDFLRDEYEEYELLFRPHRQRTDMTRLNLKGFTILKKQVPTEELFATETFAKVISIKSTACSTASDFGHPAYVLYPWIGLSESMTEYSASFFRESDRIVRVHKLSDLEKIPSQTLPEVDELFSVYHRAIVA